ncbi:hypothetical protein Tco_0405532 [Tanacetum coccineum]
MGDEHLDTIPETESDEVIKSSVENLIPIPSESEGIPDKMCDVPLSNNPTPLNALNDHYEIVVNLYRALSYCLAEAFSCKVRVGSNGNLLWEASVLLGRKKGYAFWVNQCASGFHGVNEPGGVRVAPEDDHGVMKEENMLYVKFSINVEAEEQEEVI